MNWQQFADACRAEWLKARTLATTGWLLATTVVVGVGLNAAVCAVVHPEPGDGSDPVRLAFGGVQLAQAVLAIWAVRMVAGEYRSGMIRTSLTAIPRRSELFAAKSAVVAALTLATGAITVTSCLLVARILFAANGFSMPEPAGVLLRATVGSILYLTLIGLLATGIGFAVCNPAAATATALSLLYLVPLAAQLTGNAAWRRHLQQIGPSTAGLTIQATTNLHTLPVNPWTGLAILIIWTTGTLLAGGLGLHLRHQ